MLNKESQILSEVTTHLKYAKYSPELKRRETWGELVDRNRSMHLKKFPELETYKMYLGSNSHPNFKVFEETRNKVGFSTLDKFQKLKYILNTWNSIEKDNPDLVKLTMDSIFKQNKMYNFAKALREEFNQPMKGK